jgi:hypothetical protein
VGGAKRVEEAVEVTGRAAEGVRVRAVTVGGRATEGVGTEKVVAETEAVMGKAAAEVGTAKLMVEMGVVEVRIEVVGGLGTLNADDAVLNLWIGVSNTTALL